MQEVFGPCWRGVLLQLGVRPLCTHASASGGVRVAPIGQNPAAKAKPDTHLNSVHGGLMCRLEGNQDLGAHGSTISRSTRLAANSFA
jgi:hypothetical protein